MKPALARNSLKLIGATTLDEYRKTIEKDKALSRRFQTVMVEEPSAAITLRILKGIKKHYEDHHGVVIPDEVIETAIVMSQRYINDRFMPDKVIDVIDDASAICKVAADKKDGGKYKKLKIEKTDLEEKVTEAAEAEDFEKAALLKTQLSRIEDRKKWQKEFRKNAGSFGRKFGDGGISQDWDSGIKSAWFRNEDAIRFGIAY